MSLFWILPCWRARIFQPFRIPWKWCFDGLFEHPTMLFFRPHTSWYSPSLQGKRPNWNNKKTTTNQCKKVHFPEVTRCRLATASVFSPSLLSLLHFFFCCHMYKVNKWLIVGFLAGNGQDFKHGAGRQYHFHPVVVQRTMTDQGARLGEHFRVTNLRRKFIISGLLRIWKFRIRYILPVWSVFSKNESKKSGFVFVFVAPIGLA